MKRVLLGLLILGIAFGLGAFLRPPTIKSAPQRYAVMAPPPAETPAPAIKPVRVRAPAATRAVVRPVPAETVHRKGSGYGRVESVFVQDPLETGR